MKNHKTFINFVSTIFFPAFPDVGNFGIKLLLVLCAFQLYVECLYRQLFLEDTCSNIKVTQKVHSITGNNPPTLCGVN